jgi:HAD superfamily hydrolase (TIGR01490 family)
MVKNISIVRLAIFDLDNTLIGGDSDYTWGKFLGNQGLVDPDWYNEMNEKFYKDYREGKLDIYDFLQFALKPLAEYPYDRLLSLREKFISEWITPLFLPKAEELIEQHRNAGHILVVITATNRFVTEPIAAHYGIENLLATEPEFVNRRFTGKISGIPCFQEGKITRLQNWLETEGLSPAETWFYSDSHNDLPLLNKVDHPVAVDPDEKLAIAAKQSNWLQISLR